jgi:hypothetical protein
MDGQSASKRPQLLLFLSAENPQEHLLMTAWRVSDSRDQNIL